MLYIYVYRAVIERRSKSKKDMACVDNDHYHARKHTLKISKNSRKRKIKQQKTNQVNIMHKIYQTDIIIQRSTPHTTPYPAVIDSSRHARLCFPPPFSLFIFWVSRVYHIRNDHIKLINASVPNTNKWSFCSGAPAEMDQKRNAHAQIHIDIVWCVSQNVLRMWNIDKSSSNFGAGSQFNRLENGLACGRLVMSLVAAGQRYFLYLFIYCGALDNWRFDANTIKSHSTVKTTMLCCHCTIITIFWSNRIRIRILICVALKMQARIAIQIQVRFNHYSPRAIRTNATNWQWPSTNEYIYSDRRWCQPIFT